MQLAQFEDLHCTHLKHLTVLRPANFDHVEVLGGSQFKKLRFVRSLEIGLSSITLFPSIHSTDGSDSESEKPRLGLSS